MGIEVEDHIACWLEITVDEPIDGNAQQVVLLGMDLRVDKRAVQETLLRACRYRDSVKEGAPVRPGSTAWLRPPASKVCLWCGSQHRPKHFNEGAYTVVTDRDSDLRDRAIPII